MHWEDVEFISGFVFKMTEISRQRLLRVYNLQRFPGKEPDASAFGWHQDRMVRGVPARRDDYGSSTSATLFRMRAMIRLLDI